MKTSYFKRLVWCLDLPNETKLAVEGIYSMDDIDLMMTVDGNAYLMIYQGVHHKRERKIPINANYETLRIIREMITIWKESRNERVK